MSALDFDARIHGEQLQNDIDQINRRLKGMTKDFQREGQNIDQTFKQIGIGIGAYFGVTQIAGFIKQVAQLRGQFQDLSTSFTTILNSKEKADLLMEQVVQFAATTPFNLKDVASGTKQLLAYGFQADSMIKNLRMLGDIAAGTSTPINDLIYLYGTLQTQGRAYTRDIMQFTGRGIPIIGELAKVLGVAKDEVQGLVEEGKVGFPEVEKAFQSLTKQGGMFGGLMAKQAQNINGLYSNLVDAMDQAMNKIGKSNEGAIAGAIKMTTSLVQNYEKIGEVLSVLVVTYGTYKAATMATAAYESVMAKVGAVRQGIIEEKIAAIHANIAAEQKAAAAAATQAAAAQAQAASIALAEQIKQAAIEKTAVAKEAAAAANMELIAAEKAYAMASAQAAAAYAAGAITEKQLLLKKELAVVEKARAASQKANLAVQEAVTSQTIVLSNLEAQAVEAAAAKEVAAKKAIALADRDRLIASQAATAGEIKASMGGGLLKTLTKGANPYLLIAASIFGIFYALSKLAPKIKTVEERTAELNKEMGQIDQQIDTDKLINRYEQLAKQQTRTTEEQQELNETIQKLGTIFPDARNGMNSYGEAIDLNTEKLRANSAMLRDNIKAQGEKTVADNQKALDAMIEERNQLQTEVNNKSKKVVKGWGFGMEDKALSPKELEERTQKIRDLVAVISTLGGTIAAERRKLNQMNAENAAEGLKPLADYFKKVEDYTREKALEAKAKLVAAIGTIKNSKGEVNPEADRQILAQVDALDQYIGTLITFEERIAQTRQKLKDAQKAEDEMYKPGNTFTNKQREAQAETVAALTKELDEYSQTSKKDRKKWEDDQQKSLEKQKELSNMEVEIRRETERKKTEALQEGRAKQLELARISYDEELRQIEKQRQDYLNTLNEKKLLKITDPGYITSLPKDDPTEMQLNEQKIIAEKRYTAEVIRINKEAADTLKEIWQGASDDFISEQQRQFREIDKKYDDWIKLAIQQGAGTEQIWYLNQLRGKAKVESEINVGLQLVDEAEKNEQQLAEIQVRGLNREEKIEKKKNEIALKFARQRVAILQKGVTEQDKKDLTYWQGVVQLLEQGNNVTKAHAITYEDLIEGAREFTQELGEQLGLAEEQVEAFSQMLTIVSQLAKGDYVGAVISVVGMVAKALQKDKTDPTVRALENINTLLTEQSQILQSLKGEDYFALASLQMKEYAQSISLATANLKKEGLVTEEQIALIGEMGMAAFQANTSGHRALGKVIEKQLEQLRKQWKEETTQGWTADDYIKAYTSGKYNFAEQQTEWIQTIIEAEKKSMELIQETFREALGFDAQSVAQSIFEGLDQGFKLGTASKTGSELDSEVRARLKEIYGDLYGSVIRLDSPIAQSIRSGLEKSKDSLGDFAQSFGKFMKTALTKSIQEALEKQLTDDFLKKYKEYMSDGQLSPWERDQLEQLYIKSVQQAKTDHDNIKKITDPYLKEDAEETQQSALTGAVKGIEESTAALIAGHLIAIRDYQVRGMEQGVEMMGAVNQMGSHLSKISSNTGALPAIRLELVKMNQILTQNL